MWRLCVVRELISLEGFGAWRSTSLLANAWTRSSSLDGRDDTDEDDTDEDKDEFRTRLLPTDAFFVFAFFAKRQPSFLDDDEEESPRLLLLVVPS